METSRGNIFTVREVAAMIEPKPDMRCRRLDRVAAGSGSSSPARFWEMVGYVDLSDGLDAIVVGTGFGGAVAGARLAQAGLRVAMLERGRRWPRGSFPRDDTDLKAGWLWEVGGGLFDIRWLDRMVSVHAAGWGGGSLVYANVFARPSDETFRPHWPISYSRATLDRYFDLAAHMLEVRPIQVDPATGQVPVRTRAMEDLVERMDRAAGTVRPNLAVRFAADPNVQLANRHGVLQYVAPSSASA